MTTTLVSSNEFASMVSKLQQNPLDPHLKMRVVRYFPQMKQWAQNVPMALYHLARVYMPNSAQYKNTMAQAAEMGCTNAMLDLCELYAKSDNAQDNAKAISYLQKIAHSQDSYIKKSVQELAAKYPLLVQEKQIKNTMRIDIHGFFAQKNNKTQLERDQKPNEILHP
ncbi:MAG: hypothetical protein QM652_11170 [Legionella sp.]|uniref:hypothetical protein n=1 Tax=Legionella sp. TaxID=459 RepID=UPI0039E4B205